MKARVSFTQKSPVDDGVLSAVTKCASFLISILLQCCSPIAVVVVIKPIDVRRQFLFRGQQKKADSFRCRRHDEDWIMNSRCACNKRPKSTNDLAFAMVLLPFVCSLPSANMKDRERNEWHPLDSSYLLGLKVSFWIEQQPAAYQRIGRNCYRNVLAALYRFKLHFNFVSAVFGSHGRNRQRCGLAPLTILCEIQYVRQTGNVRLGLGTVLCAFLWPRYNFQTTPSWWFYN